jgi:excinuclease ABC subunit C
MNTELKKLNKTIPKHPGIYLFKDLEGRVIYIGKAKCLHKRVSSYFQKQHLDNKIYTLIQEHVDIEYILTKNETEALLLEAQLIRTHQPKFNVLLKSGQPFVYILFTKEPLPQIKLVRNKQEKGTYFGPFLHKTAARQAYDYLMRTFKLFRCNKKIAHGCLDYHIGICPGSCKENFDTADYLFRAQLAQDVLKKTPQEIISSIKEKIMLHNQNFDFEKSRILAEYIPNIDIIVQTLKIKFHEHKFDDEVFAATAPLRTIEGDYLETAQEIQNIFKLHKLPLRIDCFDISHFQGHAIVGSCVRFANGKPDKNNFRKFNIKTLIEQNDYAALQEIVSRRYKSPDELPDLILIDGGKGQLSAAQRVRPDVDMISLAKKEETIFSKARPEGVILDIRTNVGQLLIALRDYAHHFAISHHRTRRKKDMHEF